MVSHLAIDRSQGLRLLSVIAILLVFALITIEAKHSKKYHHSSHSSSHGGDKSSSWSASSSASASGESSSSQSSSGHYSYSASVNGKPVFSEDKTFENHHKHGPKHHRKGEKSEYKHNDGFESFMKQQMEMEQQLKETRERMEKETQRMQQQMNDMMKQHQEAMEQANRLLNFGKNADEFDHEDMGESDPAREDKNQENDENSQEHDENSENDDDLPPEMTFNINSDIGQLNQLMSQVGEALAQTVLQNAEAVKQVLNENKDLFKVEEWKKATKEWASQFEGFSNFRQELEKLRKLNWEEFKKQMDAADDSSSSSKTKSFKAFFQENYNKATEKVHESVHISTSILKDRFSDLKTLSSDLMKSTVDNIKAFWKRIQKDHYVRDDDDDDEETSFAMGGDDYVVDIKIDLDIFPKDDAQSQPQDKMLDVQPQEDTKEKGGDPKPNEESASGDAKAEGEAASGDAKAEGDAASGDAKVEEQAASAEEEYDSKNKSLPSCLKNLVNSGELNLDGMDASNFALRCTTAECRKCLLWLYLSSVKDAEDKQGNEVEN